MVHERTKILVLVAVLRSVGSIQATPKQNISRREAQLSWDKNFCVDTNDSSKGFKLERHTHQSHGDVCRDTSGGFFCPLLETGLSKKSSLPTCANTASGNAPFYEMPVMKNGQRLPCRVPRASEEWLSKEMQRLTAVATRAPESNSISEKRWITCVKERGFTKGKWIRSQKAIPGSGCEANSTSWMWQPNIPLCRLSPLSADSFCETMERAHVKKILLIGDSLMRLWSGELLKLRKLMHHCYLNVTYLSSNQMTPSDVANVHAELLQLKPEVVIMNWGAHYGKRDRNGLEEVYANETRLMAATFAKATSQMGVSAPLLIYRSTSPGHPGCESVPDRPASSKEVNELWLQERIKPLHERKSYHFQWDVFPKFNNIAMPLWSKIAGALPMDVEELAKLRPDLHIDPTSSGNALGVVGPDCLHYRKLACSGGLMELNTWWTALFQNIIESKPFHTEKFTISS